MNKLPGIPVSSGIIIGKARFVHRSRAKIIYQYLVSEERAQEEIDRFQGALATTKEQIITLKNGMPEPIKKHAFILDAHVMILDDSMLADSTIETIRAEKINAEWALKKSIQHIRQLFEQIEDEYIRDRISDVENVAERILLNLTDRSRKISLRSTNVSSSWPMTSPR